MVRRACNPSWFDSYSWLHYEESRDVVFCYLCKQASQQNKLKATCVDAAFISRGYCNWKDAINAFKKHEESKCHKDSVQTITIMPKHYKGLW